MAQPMHLPWCIHSECPDNKINNQEYHELRPNSGRSRAALDTGSSHGITNADANRLAINSRRLEFKKGPFWKEVGDGCTAAHGDTDTLPAHA